MAKRYHKGKAGTMISSFGSGAGSRDAMVSSSDGLFPGSVVMKEFPQLGHASSHEPYDGISGIDGQINGDCAMLQKRSTKGSF